LNKNMGNERKRIPIEWTEIRFEGLEINFIGLQQSISHLPQPSGEKRDKPLHLKLPHHDRNHKPLPIISSQLSIIKHEKLNKK